MDGPRQARHLTLPRLDAKRLTRIGLLFVLCLLVWSMVRGPYLVSVAWGTTPILRQVIETPGQRAIKLDGDTFVVNSGVPSPRDPAKMSSLRLDSLHQTGWNMALLTLLITLTPWSRTSRSPGWVLLAFGLVWVSQVATLGLAAIETAATFHASLSRELISVNRLAWVGWSKEYLMLIAPVLPVLVMLPVWRKA